MTKKLFKCVIVHQTFQSLWQRFLMGLLIAMVLYALQGGLRLWFYSTQPLDGVLVLGGSPRRELYVAKYASALPHPIIVSGGSPAACIQFFFTRFEMSQGDVWVEPCATSTFENYLFTIPFLETHQVHHVLVITSGDHRLRAERLGRIMLGFRGIAMTIRSVEEVGSPGNHETRLKMILDPLRGFLWGLFSSVLPAKSCPYIQALEQIPPALPDVYCRRDGNAYAHITNSVNLRV
jgi:uncharacterized SAM-binding protein YcdF (DUF218 family)